MFQLTKLRVNSSRNPNHSGQRQICNDYRSELDVNWVVTGEFLLQILKLLDVLAAACLHHVIKMQHSWLPTIQNNHRAEVWQSEGRQNKLNKSGSCFVSKEL